MTRKRREVRTLLERFERRGMCGTGCRSAAVSLLLAAALVFGTTCCTKDKKEEPPSEPPKKAEPGWQKPGQVARAGGCTDDSQCKAGRTCIDGTCSYGVKPCTNDSQCKFGRVCAGGKCVDPSQRKCKGDGDCAEGQMCRGGECVQFEQPCETNQQCRAGRKCQNGTCVDEAAEACVVDADCKGNRICENGSCLDPGAPCTADSDCKGERICRNGQCVERGPDACGSDRDCDECYVCDHGYCSYDYELCRPGKPAPPGARQGGCGQSSAAPGGMVEVKKGSFWMGCDVRVHSKCNERFIHDGIANRDTGRDFGLPYHMVTLDAYHIDADEVKVSEYRECLEAGKCGQPATDTNCNWGMAGKNDHPINCVDWSQAQAYCCWRGARLCTEAEWEKAARGTEGAQFPWGIDVPVCGTAVIGSTTGDMIFFDEDGQDSGCGDGTTEPVCSKTKDRSPFGACDMGGNVSEWVSDWYAREYYKTSPTQNPKGPDELSADSDTVEVGYARYQTHRYRVHRGGYYGTDLALAMSSLRQRSVPTTKTPSIGFRCCWSGGTNESGRRRRPRPNVKDW